MVTPEEATKTAWLLFVQAQEKLQQCAELLRGSLIPASSCAMQTEIAVSNAIDALRGGFRTGDR
jgi:hypothetical protein